MSKNILFPSLDQQGWVNSSARIADFIFTHFFVSDYNQTQLYLGSVSSLPWILQQYQNDIPRAMSETESTLARYFSRYFDNVVVEVTHQENADNPSKIEMTIYVSFRDTEGKQQTLGRLLQILDTKISNFAAINNG